jgi:hypothetical protein
MRERPLLSLADQLAGAAWRARGHDMTLARTPEGAPRLRERALATRVPLPTWPETAIASRS